MKGIAKGSAILAVAGDLVRRFGAMRETTMTQKKRRRPLQVVIYVSEACTNTRRNMLVP